MREVETYLSRAEEALQLLMMTDGPEARRAIVEIVRTWISLAETRALQRGLVTSDLDATFQALNDNLSRVAESAE